MDTHQAVKDLVGSGFVEGQAEAIVSFQVRFLSENVSTKQDVALIQGDIKTQRLATQHNIEMIHKDIAIIHKDIAALRAETKKDIEMVRKDIAIIHKDIASLRAETKKDIEILRIETKKDIQTELAKLSFHMSAMTTVIVTVLGGLLIYVN